MGRVWVFSYSYDPPSMVLSIGDSALVRSAVMWPKLAFTTVHDHEHSRNVVLIMPERFQSHFLGILRVARRDNSCRLSRINDASVILVQVREKELDTEVSRLKKVCESESSLEDTLCRFYFVLPMLLTLILCFHCKICVLGSRVKQLGSY